MARECQICGRTSQLQGKRKLLRGNYNPTVKHRRYPNIQWMSFSNGPRKKACVRCIKTAAKTN
ncbi:MAG: hypothetical protein A3F94_01055 [Candidatus Spechtbacteria bacterium RIFCSPLOWO2_12_FULL_38_22]|uniref:50S ribosomal protein L28 n=1 Tax=Candidatus Spechtbacteria bacterium RIFCSPLOWO2_12_FULL_38_22 TaxID=1802165 RepID=A0A1G2HI30_9BACT|nr:MAG: hypothetical protein A3A00_02480 [Candidatus Spechtbacteria bacterium RIFCSPLOWO2_01_FULL_38_20]OGZ62154.1 MAG: hypothetical protein A3F94_01055 [Candidatus Spechtbacteria bacterium RIFCSPLOWO2_12_FULL_38_22]